jgi:hypothetical protein
MSEVGSAQWRIKNYGLARFLKYAFAHLVLRKSKFLKSNLHLPERNQTLQILFETLNLKLQDLDQIRTEVFEFLLSSEKYFRDLALPVKKDVVGVHGPLDRLTVLGATLLSFQPDLYLETGTQHGVSAEFAFRFCSKRKFKTRIVSIDVEESRVPVINSGYSQIKLSNPVGQAFTNYLHEVSKKFDSVVFMHDSDHSYEHMKWELRQVFQNLKLSAIVCDDVQQHKAFENFSERVKKTPIILDCKNAPACGVLVIGDPDGT